MSQIAYNATWASAMEALTALLAEEVPAQEEVKPNLYFQTLANLYIRYVQAFRALEEAYDQIVHPQKRLLLREILDGVMGRVLELKNEMVETEASEYHYLDHVLHELKLSPAELEIPIPHYFIVEHKKEIEERQRMLTDFLNQMEAREEEKREAERKALEDEENMDSDEEDEVRFSRPVEDEEEIEKDEEKPQENGENGENMEKPMTKKEKEREKAEKAKKKEKERLQKQMEKERQEKEDKERQRRANMDRGEAAQNAAAVSIQSLWRGCMDRKATKKLREDELMFLGMMEPTHVPPDPEDNTALQATKARRRVKQGLHEKQYEIAIVTVTDDLWKVEAVTMAEAMKVEIREWINELFERKGSYPDYPDVEEGGSNVIVEENRKAAELAAGLEVEEPKEPKKKEKEAKGDKKGKKGEEEEKPQVVHLKPSNFLEDIEVAHQMFGEVWHNRDESKNFIQRYDEELIREMQRKVVEPELRLKVDEQMREELENLKKIEQERIAAESKGKKGKGGKGGKKGGKKGKGKGGKGKKDKGGKGGKKKKEEIDITADRTMDSLYQELVESGLLIKAEHFRMHDYLGDYSYLGNTLREENIEVWPSLSDVRQVITLFAILPLGSQTVHEKAPLTKAILLYGPTGVGKTMLVHTICQEIGANLFDLSPANIVGKYPGQDGLNMMLHIVFKVAKVMQPSVVWIGDADKMFNKKVPKEDKELDVKRLKKDLPKVLKALKPGERVLVLGTSRNPTGTDIKGVAKVYNKILLIPKPDYSSRYLLWKQLIRRRGGEVTSALDLSVLSKISDGYTPGLMLRVIDSILTEDRRQQLAKKPLTAEEFVEPLSKIDPVTTDETALKGWDAKTPLGKKRAKVAKEKEEALAEKQKGKK